VVPPSSGGGGGAPYPSAATARAAPPASAGSPEPKRVRTVTIRRAQVGAPAAVPTAPAPAAPRAAAPRPAPQMAVAAFEPTRPPAPTRAPSGTSEDYFSETGSSIRIPPVGVGVATAAPPQSQVPVFDWFSGRFSNPTGAAIDTRLGVPSAAVDAPAAPPQSQPSVAAVEPALPPAPTRTPRTSEGGWVVQLSAQKTEGEAQAAFRAAQAKYSVLGGHQPLIRKKDQGDRGVFYATQVGPFPREEANQLCEKLKSAGGNCFIQRN
jgi:hypothetical protein